MSEFAQSVTINIDATQAQPSTAIILDLKTDGVQWSTGSTSEVEQGSGISLVANPGPIPLNRFVVTPTEIRFETDPAGGQFALTLKVYVIRNSPSISEYKVQCPTAVENDGVNVSLTPSGGDPFPFTNDQYVTVPWSSSEQARRRA